MAKYYTVINEDGRFLKFRTGSAVHLHAWVKGIKGASYGTEAQMRAAIEQMKNSPYYSGLKLHLLGEAESGWMAKREAVDRKSED